MNKVIAKEIKEIRRSISSAKDMSDDFLFTVVCHKNILIVTEGLMNLILKKLLLMAKMMVV